MVRTRSDRSQRRTKGAGPARQGSRRREGGLEERSDEERYPNLRAQEEMDRQQHVRAAREMGATRAQASRHADSEVGGH
jgi:hypothetical protein